MAGGCVVEDFVAVVDFEFGGFARGVVVAATHFFGPVVARAGEVVVQFAQGVIGFAGQQAILAEVEGRAGEAVIVAGDFEAVSVFATQHTIGPDDRFDMAVGAEGGFGAVDEIFDQEAGWPLVVAGRAEHGPGDADGCDIGPEVQDGAEVERWFDHQIFIGIEEGHPGEFGAEGLDGVFVGAKLIVGVGAVPVEHADVVRGGEGAGAIRGGVGRLIVEQDDGVEADGELVGDPFRDVAFFVFDDGDAGEFHSLYPSTAKGRF